MNNLLQKWSSDKWDWSSVENVQIGRENLGEEMPVYLYRLFQFTLKDEMIEVLGKEKTIEIFRSAGKKAGIEFALNRLDLTLAFNEFITHLQSVLEKDKIGVLRVGTDS